MKQTNGPTIPLQKLLILHSDYVNDLQRRSPETRGTYERTLREFMRWVRNEPDMGYSVKDVERYKKYLLTKRKLSPVSVTMYLSSVRKFFDYLMKRGALTENASRKVKGGAPPTRHTRKSISVVEVQQLIQAIDRNDEIGFRDFSIVKLMVGCGVSEIELVRADVGDVKRKKEGMIVALQAKGMKSKEMIVSLPKDVSDALKGYLAYRTNAGETDPLFMSAGNRTRGQRMTSRGIRERINFYLTKAGIKNGEVRKITPLSLRNAAIKLMIAQGANMEEIKKRFRIVKDSTVKLYQTMN
ncbi:MAG: tyrosine-type recombinase/integrase [Ignavibacteriales bacterium]|nr:tyrosine-type recombinase/integrase [Ignavibacteriales bacterium]